MAKAIKNLSEFLTRLNKTSGSVTVVNGVIKLKNGQLFDLRAALKPAYAVVQEGGSSVELYLHSTPSRGEATSYRKDCAKAAYRTSPVIKLSAAASALGEDFYEPAEEIMSATKGLSYP